MNPMSLLTLSGDALRDAFEQERVESTHGEPAERRGALTFFAVVSASLAVAGAVMLLG